jgi:hypothetical protein
MAGKRQHYLPQFLQRGFASGATSHRTWLYLKNAPPREVGIRDVGVEENFYDAGPDALLDEMITDAERDEFAGVIDRARKGNVSDEDLSNLVPCFIAHLEVRSRHIRMVVAELLKFLWDEATGCFEDAQLASELVREHVKRNPAELRKIAARELRSKGLPMAMAPSVAKQLAQTISDMPDDLLISAFWTPLLPHIRAGLIPRIYAIVKQAHLNALLKSIAPEIRTQQYRPLQFSVVEIASNDLILGDAGVVFEVEGTSSWKPFLDKDDIPLALFLPISQHQVIVGCSTPITIDPVMIRQQIARTSHTFFISAQRSSGDMQLSDDIGTAARPLSIDKLRSIVRQGVTELLPSRS